MPIIRPEMKPALPLLAALVLLPLTAFADDPMDSRVPAGDPGDPTPAAKIGEPAGFTVIPLGDIRVISVQDMMKTGGLITAENFSDPKRKKKKKKRTPLANSAAAAAAGVLGIAAVSGSGGGSQATQELTLDDRAPTLPGNGTVTRAAVSPEPGSAALCLLLLPVAVGYFRTRSKNA